ncbi:DNA cytosine methyltransferase [Staphylococcus pseudintermedius]|uniref:Cytosine-specific methyltransferase n=1 Tax=Staphylococcus pseudintermedius TaxID=283734 RepID=A0A7T7SWL2_STAPS|nr:DNA cytosine methyltransferase [Staphylococcus pseudintermedius]ASQ49644.1 modification methylase [Staphylococcus pseudintermedius]EGQ0364951.1 DNA cytosine methyltransferase [Staphylococcus pseudintermedius]EGQ1736147.1 DNA cytosine methyltransferase [Staphylococcus pseudintermedius]EGQ1743254.1 DNA cytosine methyltransferase [Staphylococcus pseudintermedius]EGQ2797068.1 DNA cytosine methyltransferase [Staphylococcus pseudintermedius]
MPRKTSSNVNKYTLTSFFSGVGGIELGFEQTQKFKTIYSNEFDKNAQITFLENFPEHKLDKRDIHDVCSSEVPNSDIVVGGFPCQAFSIAGYQKGFEDERGDLFFELLRIVKDKKPEAVFIENVKNMVTHDNGNTFKVIRQALTLNGYNIKWKVMNSKDYGDIPQNRERIYIVGFRDNKSFDKFQFPDKILLKSSLTSVINFKDKVDEKYYYKEGKQPFYHILFDEIKDSNAIYQWRRKYVRMNKNGVVPTLTANMGTGGHNVPLIKTEHGIRKLTPRETFNVQGFPESFKLPAQISNGQLYKQSGNSVVVPLIKRIAENISIALDNGAPNSTDYKEHSTLKFNIIHSKIYGRFEGESKVIFSSDTLQDLETFALNNKISFISNSDYLNAIKKDKVTEFYSFLS